MDKSSVHNLNKPKRSDNIIETIDSLAENFEIIDKLIDEKASFLNTFLVEGTTYERGKKIWNNLPEIGGNVGWVNIRTGKHAPTWQERTTYRLGDLVSTEANNGHVYECIETGVSGVSQPQFPTATNQSIFDFNGSMGWMANKVYEVDDIVLATNGNQLYHFRCITRGTSGSTEPEWSFESGITFNDGSVVWQSYKTVKWKEIGVSSDFRPFGTIL